MHGSPRFIALCALALASAGCGSDTENRSPKGTGSETTGAGGGGNGPDSRSGGSGADGSGGNASGGSGAVAGSGGSGGSRNEGSATGGRGGGDGTPATGGAGGDASTSTDGAAAGAGGEGGAPVSYSYDCGAFSEDPGWTVLEGYRAVIVADADDGLNQPVGAAFAEGPFGGRLYVANQGDDTLRSIDISTGDVTLVVAAADWDAPAGLLTTVVWDEHRVFDGNLYIGDQGSNADNNSRVYRVTPEGKATTFALGGYGLDDVYGLAFPPPGSDYEPGLYVTGDTDNGARPDWGILDDEGVSVEFSDVTGAEGIAFDTTGLYGGQLWASRPNGGGYAGDDSITPVDPTGYAGTPIATGLTGIHAVTFSTGGALGRHMYAASWSTGRLLRIDPEGDVIELASGLSLTNYDGNILAVSSDGNVMFVADRLHHQLVCIEPVE